MREILFRGKRAYSRGWVEGHLIVFPKSKITKIMVWNASDLDFDAIEVIPETVGQFTGLADKNGKQIFEGDIVRWPGLRAVGIVQYGEFNCSCCDGVFGWHFGTEDIRDHDSYEVIGNIHDNPELLPDND